MWRDQNEKFYLKSLDHQGLQFKQTDVRNLRSKSLLNEIETLYDERHEQEEANGGEQSQAPVVGPHKNLEYHDPAILIDANNLLIHHVKRQTGIHKDDKHKIKVLLRHFVLDLFKHQRQELSDDERDEDDDDEKEDEKEDGGGGVSDKEGEGKDKNGSKATRAERARKKKSDDEGQNKAGKKAGKKEKENNAVTEADVKAELSKGGNGRRTPLHARDMEGDESYSHIMCNNHWYIFFRLHHILCERLTKMYNQSLIIRAEETKDRGSRKESTAVALRLKPKSEWRNLLGAGVVH